MYAPLDFRFVIGPEPTITNLQQDKAATDRHGFARIKNKSLFMCQFVAEGYSLWWRKMALKILLLCAFRPKVEPKPSSNTQLR